MKTPCSGVSTVSYIANQFVLHSRAAVNQGNTLQGRDHCGVRLVKGSVSQIPIEERHDLRSGAIVVRAERGAAGAIGNAIGNRPLDGRCVVGINRHICKAGAADRRGTGIAVPGRSRSVLGSPWRPG